LSVTSNLRRVDCGFERVKRKLSKCFLNCEYLTVTWVHTTLSEYFMSVAIHVFYYYTFINILFLLLYLLLTLKTCVSRYHILRLFDGSLKFFERKLCNMFSFGHIRDAFDKFWVTEVHVILNVSVSVNKFNKLSFMKF